MNRHIFRFNTIDEYKAREPFDPPHIALIGEQGEVCYDPVEEPNTIVNGYEFVDMGLSVKWATCNIGATKPEETGWFFQWAGTIPYNYDATPIAGGEAIELDYNSNCPYWIKGAGMNSKWSKYVSENYCINGDYDNKYILDPEDDAAHVHIGGNCRMPTKDEYLELKNSATWKQIEDYNETGVCGRQFTSTINGKSIFIPVYDFSSIENPQGFYWSSERPYISYNANMIYIPNLGAPAIRAVYRYKLCTIRPVLPN